MWGFSLYSLRGLSQKGKVLSLEPHPENFGMLVRNLDLNRCQNVTPLNVGLAGKSGPRRLYLSRANTAAHSLFKPSEESIKIATTDLQSLLETYRLDNIDLLKLDCEGAEHEVLETLPSTVFNSISRIAMEYHILMPEKDESSLSYLLRSREFAVRTVPDGTEMGMIYAIRRSKDRTRGLV